MLFILGVLAFLFTILGGLFALKFKDKLHLVLGFSAGAVLGVAFFDLLPEAMEIGGQYYDLSLISLLMAGGFVVYMLLDRLMVLHCHHEENCANHDHVVSGLGAGSLSVHSFFDGIIIGIAWQSSATVGLIVALAVLAHNFADGLNTVSLVLREGGKTKQAFEWLITAALAPIVGILTTMYFNVPENYLGLILAVFCGFFLYLGASDLLPESHHNHPTKWTTMMTILGMSLLLIIIKIAG